MEDKSDCFEENQANIRVKHSNSSIFMYATCRVVGTPKYAPAQCYADNRTLKVALLSFSMKFGPYEF